MKLLFIDAIVIYTFLLLKYNLYGLEHAKFIVCLMQIYWYFFAYKYSFDILV